MPTAEVKGNFYSEAKCIEVVFSLTNSQRSLSFAKKKNDISLIFCNTGV
jgi:hypothetical protein